MDPTVLFRFFPVLQYFDKFHTTEAGCRVLREFQAEKEQKVLRLPALVADLKMAG